MKYSSLSLKNLGVKTYLGVTAEERAKRQEVSLDIVIKFPTFLLACKTDNIEDTVCYQELTGKIFEFCKAQKSSLIEHLGYELFLLVKKNLPKDALLMLSIAKKKPLPILKNSIFTISDWE